MPTPFQITDAVMTAREASNPQFLGQAFYPLAKGIGDAVSQWGTGNVSNLGLTGTATGTSGSGTITPYTTKMVVPNDPSGLLAALQGAKINGVNASALATVVATGISTAFSSFGQYAGAVVGVGSGQDVSSITTVNGMTLAQTLFWSLDGAFESSGPNIVAFCEGLGFGIADVLFSGTGTGTVVGPAGPSPASTATTSAVV